jgi:hypothetical protein
VKRAAVAARVWSLSLAQAGEAPEGFSGTSLFLFIKIPAHSLSHTIRDESGSDRIIHLPHLHPYFFVGCGAEQIFHRCGYGCGFFRMSDMVRSQIGCGADAD